MQVARSFTQKLGNTEVYLKQLAFLQKWPRRTDIKTTIKEGFKNGDEKIIPLSPDAQKVLKELKGSRTGELVFDLRGEYLEYRFIQYAYDAAARSAKLDFKGTHVMRRTGASWILNQTGDIDLAKQLLGNTTWSTQIGGLIFAQPGNPV